MMMNLLFPNTTSCLHSVSLFPLQPPLRNHRRRPKNLLLCSTSPSSIRAQLDQNDNNNKKKNVYYTNSSSSSEIENVKVEVEVIVLGSRKDSVLDFCSTSPSLSPALRFWNIIGHGSHQLQLQQRFAKQDSSPKSVENLWAQQSSCKAVILVASAAYGPDHVTALDVLSNASSGNGFVVGIILKPFRFEGERRQDEVKDLVGKLQKHANFCIVLDTDALLENDLVTLDEALRTSNNAVLMAMNAISILISEKHTKLLNTKHNSTRELQLPEFKEIFGSFKEARIAFGVGYNVKNSFSRAINECPFLGVDVKEHDGLILCIFASSGTMDCCDANTILQTLRPITGQSCEIIVSIVHEPNMEPKAILATVIAFGYARKQLAPRNGLFSSLGQHIPFIFNIFKKQYHQPITSEKSYLSNSQCVSDLINAPTTTPDANSLDVITEDPGIYSGKLLSGNTDEKFFSSSNFPGEREVESMDANSSYSFRELNPEEPPMFKRELLRRGNLGSNHPTELSKDGASFSEVTTFENVSICKLPVGVKHSEKLDDTPQTSKIKQGAEWIVDDKEKKQHHPPRPFWSGFTEAGVNTIKDLNPNKSGSNKRNYTNNSTKQGGVSLRAASMLESERDSQKKWNRVAKMNYRGGIYRGHAQGGLPEGKGRLLLGDGSIYDGMWRYGKRSGLGTFYFDNGDVFQGSWRDDVMHGKGWFYFHTGDRWFANFWKGKANGEGRFYSHLGDVFFGHFKDGWRHGLFLHINVDGTRCEEIWDDGVLISKKQLDPDAEVG